MYTSLHLVPTFCVLACFAENVFRMGTTDRTPLELEAFLRTQQPIFTPVSNMRWRFYGFLHLLLLFLPFLPISSFMKKGHL